MSDFKQQIVAEARGWLGTPFHHQGRARAGVDCIGLVLGVLEAVQCLSRAKDEMGARRRFSDFDECDYAPDPNSERLREKMDAHFYPLHAAALAPGDVLLFRILRLPQHVGIVGNHPYGGLSLIHAYSPAAKVVEEKLAQGFLSRVIAAYRVPAPSMGGQ